MSAGKRGTVGAKIWLATFALSSLTIYGTVLAASQQDWDACQGKDPAAAVAACSRIVSDQSEPPQKRADAYLLRATAYLSQGTADRAIADYGEAIKLAPGNVAAWIGRALAYFTKHDRAHAAIDYSVAVRLDAKRVAELAAANAQIEQIKLVARGMGPPPATQSATGAFCPTVETGRYGFVLVAGEPGKRIEVKPPIGNVVWTDFFKDGTFVATMALYKGRYPILIRNGAGILIFTYDADYTKAPDLGPGYDQSYHTTMNYPDGRVTTFAVEDRVTGREKVTIGDCTLNTFAIEVQSAIGEAQKAIEHNKYSPELGMLLPTFIPDFNYARIEHLSR